MLYAHVWWVLIVSTCQWDSQLFSTPVNILLACFASIMENIPAKIASEKLAVKFQPWSMSWSCISTFNRTARHTISQKWRNKLLQGEAVDRRIVTRTLTACSLHLLADFIRLLIIWEYCVNVLGFQSTTTLMNRNISHIWIREMFDDYSNGVYVSWMNQERTLHAMTKYIVHELLRTNIYNSHTNTLAAHAYKQNKDSVTSIVSTNARQYGIRILFLDHSMYVVRAARLKIDSMWIGIWYAVILYIHTYETYWRTSERHCNDSHEDWSTYTTFVLIRHMVKIC